MKTAPVYALSKKREFASALFLHPLGGPLAYLVYALLIPLVYMSFTGNGIGSIPHAVLNVSTLTTMLLTIFGYVVGALVGGARLTRRQVVPSTVRSDLEGSDANVAHTTSNFGRGVLGLVLLAKLYQLSVDGLVSSSIYGSNQLDYTTTTTIAIAGEALVAVGCILVMYGNTVKFSRPLLPLDWFLLLAIVAISLVGLGSRGEVISPILLFLWFRLRSGKKIRVGFLALGTATVAVVFLAIAQFRSQISSAVVYPFLQTLLWQTSSPALLTSNVAQLVPQSVGFYGGSTYLEAVKSMLPGPVARELFDGVQGTGTFVYRDLIGFTDRGQGWGFSLPTEAYLNFGQLGVFIVALLLGLLFSRAYMRAALNFRPNSLSSYVYPLLLSYLPYGLRSDALGQLKSIVYPLIIIWLVIVIARTLVNARSARLAVSHLSRIGGTRMWGHG